jgi:8-oxo-dGTP pyrophosphatase MutT (NUDIX family)
LPGGHIDPGESASDAAIRETAEESGITVEITGIADVYTVCQFAAQSPALAG